MEMENKQNRQQLLHVSTLSSSDKLQLKFICTLVAFAAFMCTVATRLSLDSIGTGKQWTSVKQAMGWPVNVLRKMCCYAHRSSEQIEQSMIHRQENPYTYKLVILLLCTSMSGNS
jgi:hypothetical protein